MRNHVRGSITRIVVSVFLATLLSSPVLVFASPVSETVSLSTGNVDLVSGLRIRLTCSMPVELSTSSYTIEPGRTKTCYVSIMAGTVSLSVYIPSPIDEWHTVSRDLIDLGSMHISIVPFINW
ncbi:hypothetical protein GTO27_04920 [Candidatus Bathyarchaeota archaeon]|nr:hypothetical protein [Candidatus Bathyarchaeota archaeon]